MGGSTATHSGRGVGAARRKHAGGHSTLDAARLAVVADALAKLQAVPGKQAGRLPWNGCLP